MAKASKRAIGIWLMIGVFMILVQIVLGGITRLTESGLSITEWNVVTGTLPPLNQAQWQDEFELYKQSPQYQKVNVGMTLEEFKFIFFWEYFHRLWGRILGFVFLIPFIYFLVTRSLDKPLIRKALVAFLLGGLVGIFGWIMVASGLEDRPLVSPYKLGLHLSLALITLAYLWWVGLSILTDKEPSKQSIKGVKQFAILLTVLISVQIFLGALVSGMRAATLFPTWPLMNGTYIPDVLLNIDLWTWENFVHFERSLFSGALMQFLHRNLAYVITILSLIFIVRSYKMSFKSAGTKVALYIFPVILIIQILLGIFTLLTAIPRVNIPLGVIHQFVAILLLLCLLYLNYKFSGKEIRQP